MNSRKPNTPVNMLVTCHNDVMTRTCNLRIRSPTPYPLGHKATLTIGAERLYVLQLLIDSAATVYTHDRGLVKSRNCLTLSSSEKMNKKEKGKNLG
ncbi:hypothetical protein Y032_0041g465 [Ancylostoma ceylanicum]|uniref:Uncharacterized protein n=1 Tax=Ancylostoma ceylanicum TaxID=53326 RepID=A0A016UI53_9BILA|nr:hypothetical protein Y032_0041g465 [Ancylostoma ceylanicum]